MPTNDRPFAADMTGAGSPGGESSSPEWTHDLASALAEVARLRAALTASRTRETELSDELQHRVRNLLASIRSMYRQTMATCADQEDFPQHFQGRLDVIARHYKHAGVSRSPGAALEDMLRDELLQFHCLDGSRCSISGPEVRLHGQQAELMGLAIHELATNAMKFGAIGNEGTLSINWSLTREDLHFRWAEYDTPVAALAPRRTGFGRQVIERALPYQLGATTSFRLQPGGMECVIDLPLDRASGAKDEVDGRSGSHSEWATGQDDAT